MDLGDIYELYFNDLYRYLFSLARNHTDTEDIIQETFTKAHTVLLTEEIQEMKPWLFKVGYYTFIDRIRKSKRMVFTEEFNQADLDTPESILAENDAFNELLSYLDRIKAVEKQAILLCDLHDFTNQQAAEILQLKVNTLKSHLLRGRKKLRNMLTEEETNGSV
jgi:RNA polymerase sigma-70 factor (ECF subfamily)